jgi:hypothetical protein
VRDQYCNTQNVPQRDIIYTRSVLSNLDSPVRSSTFQTVIKLLWKLWNRDAGGRWQRYTFCSSTQLEKLVNYNNAVSTSTRADCQVLVPGSQALSSGLRFWTSSGSGWIN